jgi:hypothetical protein
MIRTLTDAELAARHDPEPWHHPDSATGRSPFNVHDRWVFAPRVEMIPSRDPLPYCEAGFSNMRLRTPKDARPAASYAVFAPRREFARPEHVNPILNAFRQMRPARVSLADHAVAFLASLEHMGIAMRLSRQDIADARKVLERLAVLPDPVEPYDVFAAAPGGWSLIGTFASKGLADDLAARLSVARNELVEVRPA